MRLLHVWITCNSPLYFSHKHLPQKTKPHKNNKQSHTTITDSHITLTDWDDVASGAGGRAFVYMAIAGSHLWR